MFSNIFSLSPEAEFLTTYIISIISAALGLAKCLKYGVARPFAPGGPLDGLLTCRFLIGFWACALVSSFRTACVAFTYGACLDERLNVLNASIQCFPALSLSTFICFILPLLLSLISTLNFRSLSSLKILYRHPSLIILPMVTCFTFSRHNVIGRENNRVTFSRMFTGVNMLVTTIGYFVLLVWWYFKYTEEGFWILFFPSLFFLVPSFILTYFFLNTDKLCCCDPGNQQSIYDPDLDKRFIMMVDGQLKEDTEDEVETPVDDAETGANTCCGCFN